MNKNELKLGSHVLINIGRGSTRAQKQIKLVKLDDKTAFYKEKNVLKEIKYKNMMPIQLTTDWFANFGFKPRHGRANMLLSPTRAATQLRFSTCNEKYLYTNISGKKTRYVHDLQMRWFVFADEPLRKRKIEKANY